MSVVLLPAGCLRVIEEDAGGVALRWSYTAVVVDVNALNSAQEYMTFADRQANVSDGNRLKDP
jgi:hypothetical protein